jgi:hypothetical protein
MSLRVMPSVEEQVSLYHVGGCEVGLVIVPQMEGVAVYAITIRRVLPFYRPRLFLGVASLRVLH